MTISTYTGYLRNIYSYDVFLKTYMLLLPSEADLVCTVPHHSRVDCLGLNVIFVLSTSLTETKATVYHDLPKTGFWHRAVCSISGTELCVLYGEGKRKE